MPAFVTNISSQVRASDCLMTEQQAADYLGVSDRSLQGWRSDGKGPPFTKLSKRCIRYRQSYIDEWIEERTFTNTSQYPEVV